LITFSLRHYAMPCHYLLLIIYWCRHWYIDTPLLLIIIDIIDIT
jgi:hypothetical protein